MNTERASTSRVPAGRDLQPGPVNRNPAGSLKATTLFAVLLITVGIWVALVRFASGSRATGADADPVAAMTADRAGAVPVAAIQAQPPAGTGTQASSGGLLPPSAENQSAAPDNRGHEQDRPKQATSATRPITVAAGNYSVRAGEHFAEIRVHRSSLSRSDGQFVWWTEAASAKPGVDYVHQGKVLQSFPKGKSSTSFFIKLLPSASRARREVFYVAIAEPGHGASAEPVARAAIWLPTSQDHAQSAAQPAAESAMPAEPPEPRFSTAALGAGSMQTR